MRRRQFLAHASLLAGVPLLNAERLPADEARRPRVAAIYTSFYHRSHAHVILEKFLRPYLFSGKRVVSPVDIVSIYADQRAEQGDMTDDVARQYRIPIYKTIAGALTLGGKNLAVDAVLSIGEHGEYPINKFGQREYPRKRFFDEIVAEMRRSERFVPLFNDKHLSYRWDWSREMYDTCQKHAIPFMAGSSVPLAQRRPEMEIPAGAALEEAVSVHGGPFESYDFHGLEVLQSIVESRKGGETGVTSVEFLGGAALWDAARQGRWSTRLAEAALAVEFGKNLPDYRRPFQDVEPHGILITYRDGFKGMVLKVGYSAPRWLFACKTVNDDRIRATGFYVGPWRNRCLFMALSNAIQQHFVQRRSPYPVERTLLTTGMLEAAVRSRAQKEPIQTAHLNIAYEPRDFRAYRETGESWRTLTEKTPELMGITPIGER